jgi:hypothetical protein
VVAAKSLVAAALIGLSFTASALADAPAVKITSADQAKAVAALLHRTDLSAGWQGGPVKTSPITSPNCPGFDPKESDFTVSGHADARFTFTQGGIELDQDVMVFGSPQSVREDFARSISPQLARCIAYQLEKMPNVTRAKVVRLPFPPIGDVSAVYRAVVGVQSGGRHGTLLSDYVFLGDGRTEYEFTVIAPATAGDMLTRFELALAQVVLKRASKGSA